MRLLVLINPHAAGGRSLRSLPRIRARLAAAGHAADFATTPTVEEMRRRIRKSARASVDGILLAGGDGTLHQALPALAGTDVPFGVLPCGRGNDFARNLGLPTRLDTVLREPVAFVVDEIDLPRINGEPFLSITGTGLDAQVNQLACDRQGWFHGRLGYLVCIVKALRNFAPLEVRLRVDDRAWQGWITLIAVANGPGYGGGLRIAPGADMRDGWLDVCVVKKVSRLELLRNLWRVMRGRHLDHPSVFLWRGRRVEISTDRPQPIFGDGEFMGTTPAACVVGDAKIRILRPSAPGGIDAAAPPSPKTL
jgi:YegS/Rv2252/BmrU family lipid kinase